MSKLRVDSFSISIDGFGAGPNQDLQNPARKEKATHPLPQVVLTSKPWQRMHGNEDGETGVDDDVAARGFEGRNSH